MSVHIMRANRSSCESIHYSHITDQEKKEIAQNYGGYFGKYTLQSDTVIHYPEVSSFPNFIHAPLTRQLQLQDDRLVLEYISSTETSKEDIHSELAWQRCK